MIEIVAELSANHCGSLDTALKMIEQAKKAGANTIKAQAYTADTIAISGYKIKKGIWKGYDYHKLYEQGATPYDWFPRLKKASNGLKMDFFASAFDKRAVDMLEKLGVKRHKVASFEITDIALIEYMASKDKELIISTGIATDEDIIKAGRCAPFENIIWLVCTSAYPTLPKDVGLKRMKFFYTVGLSDHTKGIVAPVLSVAYNPVLIEKHFMLPGTKSIDSSFSLTPHEFKEMVDAVRTAEKMNTNNEPKVDRQFARSLWVVEDMKKGERFTEKNVKSLRPNKGLHPKYLDEVLESKSKRNIKAPFPLTYDTLQSARN